MNNYLIIIVFISILHYSLSQVPGVGRCPNVNVIQNFDVQRYTGLWYEARKYPFIFTIGGRCTTATYTLNSDSTVRVFNRQIRNGEVNSIVGTAKIVTPGIGSLTVTFDDVPFRQDANYNILYTDYEDLAVVYSCSSFLGLLNAKSVWILSRTRFPSSQTVEKAYDVLKDNGISTLFLSQTDQNNCSEDIHFNSV